jgi:hypothetical protein
VNIGNTKLTAIETIRYCCFSHIIGLSRKEAIGKPLFDRRNYYMMLSYNFSLFLINICILLQLDQNNINSTKEDIVTNI